MHTLVSVLFTPLRAVVMPRATLMVENAALRQQCSNGLPLAASAQISSRGLRAGTTTGGGSIDHDSDGGCLDRSMVKTHPLPGRSCT
jgi:hypothetical protein